MQMSLLLTDEEFSGFLTEINQIAVKYMKQASSEGSKTRQISLISAPADGRVRPANSGGGKADE